MLFATCDPWRADVGALISAVVGRVVLHPSRATRVLLQGACIHLPSLAQAAGSDSELPLAPLLQVRGRADESQCMTRLHHRAIARLEMAAKSLQRCRRLGLRSY